MLFGITKTHSFHGLGGPRGLYQGACRRLSQASPGVPGPRPLGRCPTLGLWGTQDTFWPTARYGERGVKWRATRADCPSNHFGILLARFVPCCAASWLGWVSWRILRSKIPILMMYHISAAVPVKPVKPVFASHQLIQMHHPFLRE